MNKIKVLAFYLPQFHPTPENDEWWGKGFTEWTNVAKAKPLYKGHYQPKIPADLGFYDLRLPQVREAQAELAKQAGISAFCYWHYWFGNGKQLLQGPLNDVIRLKKPNFPFCVAWANHDWAKKAWSTNNEIIAQESQILIKQEYPGRQDYIDHFYALLDAFKDERYFRIHGKLLFMIYDYIGIPNFHEFRTIWDELALKENLPGFFYITHVMDINVVNKIDLLTQIKDKGYDAINLSLHHLPFYTHKPLIDRMFPSLIKKIKSHFAITPKIVEYKEAIKEMDSPLYEKEWIYPTIIPNWDHTPRSGRFGRVFQNCTPQLFGKHVSDICKRIIKKQDEDKIIFLKSWNEWGEGNYMEPDLKSGHQYIDTLRKVLDKYNTI